MISSTPCWHAIAVKRGMPEQRRLDFNDAGPQASSIDYDAVIRDGAPEGQRSELFHACVWHLAAKGMSVEEIVAGSSNIRTASARNMPTDCSTRWRGAIANGDRKSSPRRPARLLQPPAITHGRKSTSLPASCRGWSTKPKRRC